VPADNIDGEQQNMEEHIITRMVDKVSTISTYKLLVLDTWNAHRLNLEQIAELVVVL
jgi:hypothetical protein